MIPETGAQPSEHPRPQRQLLQQQPAAIRPEFPTVKLTEYSLPVRAFRLQVFCGSFCSYGAHPLFPGKLLVVKQFYCRRRPYAVLLLGNPGYSCSALPSTRLQANLAKFPSPIVLANDGIFAARLNGGFLRSWQDGNSGEIHQDGLYPNASRSTR